MVCYFDFSACFAARKKCAKWGVAMNANNLIGNVAVIVGIISTIVLALLLYFFFRAAKLFNRLIRLMAIKDEGWSGVLAALKRRREAISAAVKAAEAYIAREPETFRNINRACERERDAQNVTETARAKADIKAAFSDFMAVMENYPDLNMDMAQIREEFSRLEDRVEKTRRYYNATVRDYNMEMDQFPANLIAGLMGFKRAAFFDTGERPRE